MATGGQQDANRGNASDFIGECAVTRSCEPCMKTNIAKAATVFCKDCNECLCETCRKSHIENKSGKHDLISIQEKESRTDVVDMKEMDKCSEHGKRFEFFCEDHSKLCCTTCVIAHRKCDTLDEIAGISKQTVEALLGLKESLVKLKSDADVIVAECKNFEKQLNASVLEVSKEVDEMRDRLIKLFDAAKDELLIKATDLKSEEVKKLDQMQYVISTNNEVINQLLPMCSAIAQHGSPQQVFILTKQIEEKHNTIEYNINEQRKTKVSSKVMMSFPGELSSLLEMGKHVIDVNFERKGNPSSIRSPLQPKPITLKLLFSVDLSKTEDDDHEPFLSGLDFLPDGRLVVADNINMKCMILNERLQRLGTPYTFKSSPKDVVVFSRSELALTMGKQKIICIMSVDSDNVISLTREISTSCEYFSICCITPTNMVVSTSNNPCHVRMISVDGVETDFDHLEFHKKTYKQGESMSTYVKPKNTLLLTDRFAHTVYMYNTVKGTTNAVTDMNIKEPRGVCVGPSDTVLVCSSLNNSIVHLSVGGEILGKYPVDMQHPFSLCVSMDGNMLAVANNKKGAKKLQLYKLYYLHLITRM